MPLLSQHLKEKLRAENEIRNAQCPVGTNKEMRICFWNYIACDQSFERLTVKKVYMFQTIVWLESKLTLEGYIHFV